MTARQLAAERYRVALSAKIDLQRVRLRLQAGVLASRGRWLGLAPGRAWQRNLLLAGVMLACGAAVFLRPRAAPASGSVWRIARLGARLWVIGKLGLQSARRLRRPLVTDSIEKTRP